MLWSNMIKGIIASSLVFSVVGCTMNTDRQAQDRTGQNRLRTVRVTDQNRLANQNNVMNNHTKAFPTKNAGDRAQTDLGNTMRNAQGNTANNNLAKGFRVSDDIADRVADMKNVDTAAAVVLGNYAYIGVTTRDMGKDGLLTDDFKQKIADEARSVDPNLQRVFVSANPNFVKQLNGYVNDFRNGRPIGGIIEGVTNVINRTFPEAK
ncbi:YhcN/YlaJ family sporulation lipoprotein [Hazenella coriacea]|uniref:YhcN/YlaJ family sporulation lipoprotein n=1 Tax=Hazenella coriacea TaxID=1179467 RepID=A0A4R3L4X5_9BACL|nr:YhcN/YlaJ family sporulation lipoprotein [Hazenella coriacea]TCS94723.1 YhcN/YlaJ family sporulation lipoprotein [Hazenella coriacea]